VIKAAILAVRMNFSAVDPLDALRFLRVPAIVWVLRRKSAARFCSERHAVRRRRVTWR
jgi:hypothetical protein